jgi:hypothetical protein
MHSGSFVLWGCEGEILPQSPQLCQNVGLSVLSSVGETEGGWGTKVVLFMVKNSLVKNKVRDGALSWCNATASSFGVKVRDEVFTHFQAVAVKRTEVCEIGCLACQDGFFVNNPLDVKENMSMLLTFLFTSLTFSRSRCVLIFRVRLMLSSPNACLIVARISIALFLRFAQNLMLFLCRIHREIASSQIHNSK